MRSSGTHRNSGVCGVDGVDGRTMEMLVRVACVRASFNDNDISCKSSSGSSKPSRMGAMSKKGGNESFCVN